MLKPVTAAIAVLAVAGSSFVYAQQRFNGDGGGGNGGPRAEYRHQRLSADDFAAFADARIAALKAGLELTPDQAKNWPAFENALRNMEQLRLQRIRARQAAEQQSQTPSPTSPFDRMTRRADNMSKTSATLKQIADTGAPLYQSLTDAQKSRFMMLARMLRPHNRRHAAIDGNGWRQGRGDQRDGRWQGGHGWGPGGPRFGQNGPGPDGGMHRMMGGDGDQDSQL